MAGQPNDILHGITLKAILTQLVDEFGWDEMGRRIDIRCFTHDPSISSSLKFLRRTAWARDKVEEMYLRWRIASDAQAEDDPRNQQDR
jgi:uncharacterized protein (DUF2132 family)